MWFIEEVGYAVKLGTNRIKKRTNISIEKILLHIMCYQGDIQGSYAHTV